MAGGIREAAWPSIRQDLELSYLQIGFLLGLPAILSGLIDPLTGILADLGTRRRLVLAGGMLFAFSLVLTAASTGFWVLYPGFLLAGPLAVKLVLIGLIGLLRAGWYAILQARLYAALPGRSGTAVAVTNLASSAGALIPVALGALAQAAGLHAAMWALLAAPIALIVGLPRPKEGRKASRTFRCGQPRKGSPPARARSARV